MTAPPAPVAPAAPARAPRLARFNGILTILIRHNAWGLVRALLRGEAAPDGDPLPVRARRLLEDLGPTFIKLGQLLATRPDLVDAPFVEEFRRLYDQAPPSPPEAVRRVLEEGLGRPPERVFAAFDPVPIASASIGQVHRATLADGTPVAVKVQHAGIEAQMATDFRILRGLVRFVERTFAGSRVWRPTEHLEELQLMLGRELDYRFEMQNAARLRDCFRGDPTVHIPRVVAELSSKRVLVMEFVAGTKMTDLPAALAAGIDGRAVARHLTHAMAKQIFVHRVFHADPSPGNLMVLGRDTVAFLDFGAVGVVGARRARAILHLLAAVGRRDADGAAAAILELCETRGEVDMRRFHADVERLVDRFERERLSVADPALLESIVGIARTHRMRLPPDFALITRALFQFEGFCRALDPDYDLVGALQPLVQQVLWRDVAGPAAGGGARESAAELLQLARTLPHALNAILRKVERGEVSMRVEVAGLEGVKSAQGRSALKTGLTVLMASFVVGLAILYASPVPDARAGQFLFAAGGVLVAWTLVMVLWSESFKGRRE